jgi:hypothetical protein
LLVTKHTDGGQKYFKRVGTDEEGGPIRDAVSVIQARNDESKG